MARLLIEQDTYRQASRYATLGATFRHLLGICLAICFCINCRPAKAVAISAICL